MVVSFPLSKLEKIDSVNNSTEKSGSILIAEVDDHNDFFLETILKRNSSKILRAINVQEAIDLCRKHTEIGLVLLNIKMPAMFGIEATRQIKSFRKDLPVIAVTAFAQIGDEQKFIEAECEEYIPNLSIEKNQQI